MQLGQTLRWQLALGGGGCSFLGLNLGLGQSLRMWQTLGVVLALWLGLDLGSRQTLRLGQALGWLLALGGWGGGGECGSGRWLRGPGWPKGAG